MALTLTETQPLDPAAFDYSTFKDKYLDGFSRRISGGFIDFGNNLYVARTYYDVQERGKYSDRIRQVVDDACELIRLGRIALLEILQLPPTVPVLVSPIDTRLSGTEGMTMTLAEVTGNPLDEIAVAVIIDIASKRHYSLPFDPRRVLAVLAHELVHVQQYHQGRLRGKGASVIWEGKEVVLVKATGAGGQAAFETYANQPWEAEAFERMDALAIEAAARPEILNLIKKIDGYLHLEQVPFEDFSRRRIEFKSRKKVDIAALTAANLITSIGIVLTEDLSEEMMEVLTEEITTKVLTEIDWTMVPKKKRS